MSKRISIFLPSFNFGGAERVASILCNELVKHHEVFLVLLSSGIDYELSDKVKVVILYKNSSSSDILKILGIPLAARRYYNFCKKNKIDVSLSFLPKANFINSFTKFFRPGYKIIISQRTNETDYLNMLSPVKRRIQKLLVSSLYPKADIINANSQHALTDLKKNFGLKKATSLIYNPVSDTNMLAAHTNEAAAKVFAGYSGRFKLICVANFRPEKNHLILLQAIQLLKQKDKVVLYLMGDGNSTAVDTYIAANGLQEHVVNLGFKTNPFDYLRLADCAILSSDFEGFSNTLLEALSCGKPVISTATKGGIELLNPSDMDIIVETLRICQYGILTRPGDAAQLSHAITLLQNDEDLRRKLSLAATERIGDFKNGVIVQKFRQLFETGT